MNNVLAAGNLRGHPVQVSENDSVAVRVEAMGIDEVGRRYLPTLRVGRVRDPDYWILDAVRYGEDLRDAEWERVKLPLELWWRLAMAVLEACPEDDGDLWSLGDGVFDHLVVEPGMKARLYAERETRPKLQRLFEAMRRELPSEGVTDGWWFE